MKKKYLIKSVLTLLLTAFIILQTNGQIRIVQVDPSTEAVTIHNYGGSMVNISSYWLCSLFSYGQLIGMPIVSGSLTLVSGADVTVTSSVLLNDTAADLGLYNSPSFASSSAMEDFTQWGSSPNGRESIAVTRTPPLWIAGDFINVAPPFQYTGDGTLSNIGDAFWGTVLGIEDFENQNTFSIFPNPTASILNLQLSPSFVYGNVNVFDILGKQVLSKEINANNTAQLDVSNISKGLYLVKVSSGENTQTKRFIKQ